MNQAPVPLSGVSSDLNPVNLLSTYSVSGIVLFFMGTLWQTQLPSHLEFTIKCVYVWV